ncbi:MAG: hypothetical protein HY684_03595 [Chloroflexi bacterium]|nr:hypothetical protein [Chloroflexota bacterium]
MAHPTSSQDILEVEGSFEDVWLAMLERGWTDGLPVIPPTEDRVQRMVAASGRSAHDVIAVVPPARGVATVEKIAVNAVMAGCDPSYIPVVIAGVDAMCDPKFNLGGLNPSTNPVGVALIVNGPIRRKIGINCGVGCLGPGWRANATIGRAIRLILINLGGGVPGKGDMATHGFPGKYSFCFGENEEDNPWDPLHVERGFPRDVSTVTAASINGTVNNQMGEAVTHDVRRKLLILADAMTQMGSNNLRLGCIGEVFITVSIGFAVKAASAGMSKADVKKFLYDHCGYPADEVFNVLEEKFRFEGTYPDGIIRPVRQPDHIVVVVAGGALSEGGTEVTHKGVYMPTFGDSWSVTKPVLDIRVSDQGHPGSS